jgi:hypothetical protein
VALHIASVQAATDMLQQYTLRNGQASRATAVLSIFLCVVAAFCDF